MANHGTKRSERARARHYAKPSRQKRHERRWDARVNEMRTEFDRRAAEAKAVEEDAAKSAALAAEAEKIASEQAKAA